MVRYKIFLSYDGSFYYGWQTSLEGPSIQSCLEESLSRYLKQTISIQGASRTDRGVHATCQVALFTTITHLDKKTFLNEIREALPPDISIWDIEEVEEGFHPSLSAKEKTYEYTLYNDSVFSPFYGAKSWHIPQNLDIEMMEKGSLILLGENDFTSLSRKKRNLEKERSPICYLTRISLATEDPLLKIQITGNRFLYKMARCIAGTLTYVGLHKISLDALARSLQNPQEAFGVTAPAQGLCLKEIRY